MFVGADPINAQESVLPGPQKRSRFGEQCWRRYRGIPFAGINVDAATEAFPAWESALASLQGRFLSGNRRWLGARHALLRGTWRREHRRCENLPEQDNASGFMKKRPSHERSERSCRALSGLGSVCRRSPGACFELACQRGSLARWCAAAKSSGHAPRPVVRTVPRLAITARFGMRFGRDALEITRRFCRWLSSWR